MIGWRTVTKLSRKGKRSFRFGRRNTAADVLQLPACSIGAVVYGVDRIGKDELVVLDLGAAGFLQAPQLQFPAVLGPNQLGQRLDQVCLAGAEVVEVGVHLVDERDKIFEQVMDAGPTVLGELGIGAEGIDGLQAGA